MSSWITYDSTGTRRDWQTPTEDAVATRLAETQAGRLRYCHDARAWFVWDGALRRRDRTGAATRAAREIARDVGREPGGRVVAAGRPAFVAGALRFARDEAALAVTADAWDLDPWRLGTPAGPVDLRTGGFVPADPADGISRATLVAPAPPEAPAAAWRGFLADTFGGDDGTIAFLQRALGAALVGSAPEPIVLVACGAGLGKSTLLATILHVIGDHAYLLEATPPRQAPRGLRLVGATEIGALAGGALERVLRTDPSSTRSGMTPTILAMGEGPPRLPRCASGLRRRLHVLPFRHRPAHPDASLAFALQAEAPAILRWMIDGCLAWQAQGLAVPAAIRDATAASLAETGTLDAFLEDRCECPPDDGVTASAGELWHAWCAYAAAAGEPAGSQRLFADALSGRGFVRDRSETSRFYRRIRLRALTPDAADASERGRRTKSGNPT